MLFRSYQDGKFAFSPLFRVGVVLSPGSLVSVRVDAAYVGYGNAPSAAGQTFNLGFSGVMYRMALQVRL